MELRNKILFILAMFFVTIGVVKAEDIVLATEQGYFANIKTSNLDNGSAKISDDSLKITGINVTASNYLVILKTSKDNTPTTLGQYTGAPAPGSETSSTGFYLSKKTVGTGEEATTYYTINDTYYREFAAKRFVFYMTIYRVVGSDKVQITGGIKIESATPKHRISNSTVEIDRKHTAKLEDDVLTITNSSIGDDTNYRLYISETRFVLPEGAAWTLFDMASFPEMPTSEFLTIKKTSNGTIYADDPNGIFKSKVENIEQPYLYFHLLYKSGDKYYLLGNGGQGFDFNVKTMFQNMKTGYMGNTSTSQSDTKPLFKGIDLVGSDKFVAVFTKEVVEDAKDEDGNEADYYIVHDGPNSTCALQNKFVKVSDGYTVSNPDCYRKMAERKGDTYVTIVRVLSDTLGTQIKIKTDGTYETTSGAVNNSGRFVKVYDSVKIARPANLAYGLRLSVNLEPTRTVIYLNNLAYGGTPVPTPTNFKATAQYKIGLVDDKEILRNIRDKKSGAYEALLAYAKKTKAIENGDVKIYANKTEADKALASDAEGAVEGAIYTQNKYSADKYYFVYLEVPESATFYGIEDVYVFNSTKKDGKIVFLNTSQTKWAGIGESSSSTKKKTKNPETGIINYSLIALGISIIALAVYLKTKKVTKFPES